MALSKKWQRLKIQTATQSSHSMHQRQLFIHQLWHNALVGRCTMCLNCFSGRKFQPIHSHGFSHEILLKRLTGFAILLQLNENNRMDPNKQHIPSHMAMVPEQRPLERTRVIRPQDIGDDAPRESHLTQHSLSPEHLGVAGYVKDVAGFIKDAVQEVRDSGRRKRQERRRRASESVSPPPRPAVEQRSSSSPSPQEEQHEAEVQQPRRTQRASSPLAEAVINLFPGLDPNAQTSCPHADELRNELMRTHSRDSPDSDRGLLHH